MIIRFNDFLNENINEEDIIKIIDFPVLTQGEDFTCGDVALETILKYYGIDYREGELKKELHSTKDKGTNPNNIIEFCHKLGLKTDVKQYMTIDDLKEYIDKDIPVLIEIQAWKDWKDGKRIKTKIKYENDWKDGHLTVVIGYTDKYFILSDPSEYRKTYISFSNLMKRWHDINDGEKHIQYGIAVYGRKPKYHSDEFIEEE